MFRGGDFLISLDLWVFVILMGVIVRFVGIRWIYGGNRWTTA